MGNETSALQNVTLGEEHRIDGKQGWSLHSATKKDGGTVSVFVYKKDKQFKQYVDNAVKNLKVIRHPSIVKFLWLRSTSDADLLITEHVRPLMSVIDSMTPGEICVGLYSIIEALSFLHEKGRSCHNNVCLSSIFVNDDGHWLLGAVEYVCRFEEATNDCLQKCRNMRNQAAIPPEEKANKVEANALYGEARDAYGFGVLAEQLLEYLVSDADNDMDDSCTKTFELRVQDECLNAQPNQRPQLASLLDDRLFKTDFVEISNFLKQVTLKTEDEKSAFFSGLAEKLHCVPVPVLATRLVRPLLARFVLLDTTADECLMPHLLTPYSGANRPTFHPSALCCPLLPVALFRKHVIPELFKIFHVRDAHIRKVLLKYFPCYVEHFDEETLSDVIMPQIVLGLRDADDELVAASLHCLGDLVTLIGADTVIGQGRTRIFASGKPKFANSGTNNGTKPSSVENNGVLPERKTNQLKKPAVVERSEPVEKKKTLKELAREADRQKRKEEARQKAKERQKKREEEKAKIKRIERTAPTMSSVAPPLPEPDNQSKASIESNQSETPTQTDSEGDNWEGWDEDNTEQSIDSEIDREIEQELVTMGSPPPLNPETTPKSPNFQETAPKVTVDWSNADSQLPKPSQKGRLKLSSTKSRTSPPPQSPSSKSSLKSPNRKHVQVPDTLKKDKAKPLASKKVTKQTGNNPLGAEFDIKALDIKTSGGGSEEPDFFADMAPVITKTSGVLDIIQGGKEEKATDAGKKISGLSYAVQDTEDVAADGWGDDDFGDDWGNDD